MRYESIFTINLDDRENQMGYTSRHIALRFTSTLTPKKCYHVSRKVAVGVRTEEQSPKHSIKISHAQSMFIC